MNEERTERRLAAILAADVVGYSRLMRSDEEDTLSRLKAIRHDLWGPKLAHYRGRVVKLMGDGALVEFSSVVDAVHAAVETQQSLAAHNAELPQDRRIDFRVGINMGDVVIDGEDIHGDGVNIAARLEALAPPGGVCISGNVHEQVRDRTDLPFRDMGEQEVKNIDRPVAVWQWMPDGSPADAAAGGNEPARLALPDKPSIAVLPFDNMSGDAEQEYFSDGITEDIITALSKYRWFFVTARNSTFTYKGSAVDIKQVGRELGVHYVLEGSVRKAGNRVRISAQLIEAESGNHIWAERYDRDMSDIFELQDEITRTISAAVEPELSSTERGRALTKPTENLGAWDLFQRGLAKIYQLDHAGILESQDLFRRAIALDADFGLAHGYLAFAEFGHLVFSRSDNPEETLRNGMAAANKAVSLDRRDHFAHFALGRLLAISGDHAAAIQELETSIALNPNFAQGYYSLGHAQMLMGDAAAAIENTDLAMRLSPNDPLLWAMIIYKASAHFMAGDLDEAAELAEQACRFPTVQYMAHLTRASFLAHAGRLEDARGALACARSLQPDLTINSIDGPLGTMEASTFERLKEGLRMAGLTET